MMQIKYLHFTCEAEQLESLLNRYGADGWRLHTCEPVPTYGPNGSGVLYAFVVMDNMQMYENEAPDVEAEPKAEGIPMKG